MNECEVIENCRSFEQGQCWICENYSLYYPIDKKILCKRQVQTREERKVKKKMQKDSEASKRGKAAKRKGYQGEHELVKLLQQYHIDAKRVPLSGALKCEELSCDITLPVKDTMKRVEVKRRKSGLTTLYKWLEQDKNSNYLMVRQDNEKWLAVIPIEEFILLIDSK